MPTRGIDPLASTGSLRQRLTTLALEWEDAFGVAPPITSTIAELDAALLVGHTEATYAKSCLTSGRTAGRRCAENSGRTTKTTAPASRAGFRDLRRRREKR